MNHPSPRMIRMLKYLVARTGAVDLRKANQITLRGLALRGMVTKAGNVTSAGMAVLHEYQRAEFIARKAEHLPLATSVEEAFRLLRVRTTGKA